MFRFMIQKLIHKKWMVICLLIGNILLIAIASSNPMYKNASLQRALTRQISDYIGNTGKNPAVITLHSAMTRDGKNEEAYQKMEKFSDTITSYMGLEKTDKVTYTSTLKSSAKSLMDREDNNIGHTMKIATLSGIDNHINIISGRMYSDKAENGVLEAIVSQKTFVKANLILDEEMEFADELDNSGRPFVVKIVGVYTNSELNDSYWVKSPSEYETECFISPEVFDSTFINYEGQLYNIETTWYTFFDYKALEPAKAGRVVERTEECVDEFASKVGRVDEPLYLPILKEFMISQKKSVATLLILQVPVLVLLCAFIFMISRQMLDIERNEMALLKSRGAGKWQIIMIYLLQSALITGVSIITGIPLGMFICRVLGSANGFLEFVQRSSLHVIIDGQVFLYCLVAALVSIAVMVLPVLRDAGVSIVNYKQQKNRNKKSLWQRVYLDVIMFLVSIYGLYSFNDRKDTLMMKVMSGDSVDPLLFLCASLFIISAGLVALRIQPLIVKLVYIIGRKLWHPASFASFLQIMRTGGRQKFMMVFLILTVALGIYNATVARTILSNAGKSIEYSNGADIVLQERWKDNSAFLVSTAEYEVDENMELVYTEPDYKVYESMPQVKSLARVLRNDVSVYKDTLGKNTYKASLMGINTKEFGETVNFDSTLLPVHINEYLNVMSVNKEAVLLSMNFHTVEQFNIGDTITYANEDGKPVNGTVYGFFDYWPGYIPVSYNSNDEGILDPVDNYMIVASLSHIQSVWGVTPYQLWLKTDGETGFIYDYAKENGVEYTDFKDSAADMVEVRNDTLFQGTNGILTMSFIVVLILCSAGFLIYWILSIRQRELLFGVFRAMGMRKGEIIHMLVNEHIFSSGISVIIGAVIGKAASVLFVPLVQIFYSAAEQAVPLEVVNERIDMIRLFGVVGVVILICMVILGVLISRINISQALKLGED